MGRIKRLPPNAAPDLPDDLGMRVIVDDAAATVARLGSAGRSGGHYRLIKAATSHTDPANWVAVFSSWPPADAAWRASRTPVNLIVLAECGCARRCIVRGRDGRGNGWRRFTTCAAHRRAPQTPAEITASFGTTG